MSLGPYTSFIVATYVITGLVVAVLIGWIVLDFYNQKRQLRILDESGVTRRSGRGTVET